jgi:predicted secreted hydrolase
MRVVGSVDIDGERVEIVGHGLRDHSWGPRYWQAIDGYEWLTMNFGDDLGAMVSVIRRPGKAPRIGGVVVRGEVIDPIDDARIAIDYEPDGLFHRALTVDATTRAGQRLTIEGRVLSFIPLRNRRGERTTHVGEGMTEWRLGERTGFGLSELLRTL